MTNFFNDPGKVTVRRISFCLCISLLLHLCVVLKFGSFPSKDLAVRSGSLRVTLGASEKPASLQSATPTAAVPESRLVPQEPKLSTKIETELNAEIVKNKPRRTQQEAVPVPSLSWQPIQSFDRQESKSGIPLPGLTGAVKRVEIVFELFTGLDSRSMGTVRHLYVSEDGGNFGVSIKQVLNTGAEVVSGLPWKYEVSGRLDGQGLRPMFFDVRGVEAERLMALKDALVESGVVSNRARRGRSPDGMLDRQSLIYQFMINPPTLTGGELWLSDGIVSGLYSYRITGFDVLPMTVLGGLRTIKIVVSIGESQETIELWLVPNMHYLPVKVRHTDRNGEVTEQMAVSLDFSK